MSLKFVATGDTIVTCPYTRDYEGYQELVDFIRSADVRMNNMENPLADGDCETSYFTGMPWFRAPTSLLDEMADFGFNCYGFANNHALDYFYTGLQQTIEAFKVRGLPMAGAGMNLEEATRHCKVQTPNGSLALVALTTSTDISARAGVQRGRILARPGVSHLRHTVKYSVSEAQMAALKEIADATKVNARANNRKKLGSIAESTDTFAFGPLEFQVGPEGRMTYPHPDDVARYEKAVKAAKDDANLVVVYIHSHETKGEKEMEPDYFVETFSRCCIDWGADAVVCSGTHQIKGVELYRGKPIYYSIANLFFRPYDMEDYPIEYYERLNLDKRLSAREAEFLRFKGGTIGLFTQSYAFRCIAPVVEWNDDGNVIKAAALPLGLGFHDPKETKGFPRIANREETQLLYQQLESTCRAYGTQVTIDEDGLFVFTKIDPAG